MGIYDLELENLSRRRARIDALRGERQPEGQMVGRHYVAPSWSQRLGPMAAQIMAGIGEGKLNKEEKALQARLKREQREWIESQPEQVDETPSPFGDAPIGTEVTNPATGAREAMSIPAQDPAELNRRAQMAHALRGMDLGGVPAFMAQQQIAQQYKAPEEYTLGPGETRFRGGQQIASTTPKELAEDKLLVNIVDPTDPKGYRTIKRANWRGEQEYMKPAAATNVNLPPQETAENKKIGEYFGDLYVSKQTGATEARLQNAKLDRIEELTKDLDSTGKLTGTFMDLASAAESVGVTLDPKLGEKQGAAALAKEIALNFRNPAGGEGMPGALSDKDREFLVSMVPGMEQTVEGRKGIIETRRKINERRLVEAKMARAYRKEHGALDEDFEQMLQDYADANPIFKGESKVTPPAEAPIAAPPTGNLVRNPDGSYTYNLPGT